MNIDAVVKSIQLNEFEADGDDPSIVVEVVFHPPFRERGPYTGSAGVTVLLPKGKYTLQEIREQAFQLALEFLKHCQNAKLLTKEPTSPAQGQSGKEFS